MHIFAWLAAALILGQSSPVVTPSSRPTSAPAPAHAYAYAHFAVSTTVPQAQGAFDRGLTLLYAFNPQEARRAFQQAASLDPKLAMAQWGIAMSYGVDINTAYRPASQQQGHAAIQRAVAAERGTTQIERDLIENTVSRYHFIAAQDAEKSARAYRDAMRTLTPLYPRDPTILTLAAEAGEDLSWNFWKPNGKPDVDTEGIVALLRCALAIDPANIGANHLLIHALEASPHPQDALTAANILASATFEPAAEHLTHMPAHIFMRTGDYHGAAESNGRAVSLFQAYLHGEHAPGHEAYLSHDLAFESVAYMMSGEYALAKRAAQTFLTDVGTPSHLLDNVEARFSHCNQVTATSGYAAGYCDALGNGAARAQEIVKTLRSTGGAEASIPADLIEAKLDERAGNITAAIASLRHAMKLQDAMPYDEPPSWFFPIRERLAATYFRAGRLADAERTFRDDLLRNAKNPRSLFGLARTLEREGKANEAATTQSEFTAAWAYADSPIDMKDL